MKESGEIPEGVLTETTTEPNSPGSDGPEEDWPACPRSDWGPKNKAIIRKGINFEDFFMAGVLSRFEDKASQRFLLVVLGA